jgi:serine/threonine-protein kinase
MKLRKYEILGELGHGAMGVVYCARDPVINRLVAIKTITTTGLNKDEGLLQRFYREAQSAGGLKHTNIVTIHDMGEEEKTAYIVMELVEGESLEHLIAGRAELPLSLKLVYAMQACRAFDYAHKRGIIHRDIKPANIMVTKDGVVKVVDFGIARILDVPKTQTGMLMGTFAYMSPEQYHGEHADERSDIWSFGVLLYELICYRRPFAGDSPAGLMRNVCEAQAEPVSKYVPDCPPALQLVVSKALEKSTSERFQSMEDLLLELEPICKNLQAQSVAVLVDQSRQLVEKSQYTEARDLLRQALQVESGNQQVRSLLEKVNGELKRLLVRPKVQQCIERCRALLLEGKFQDARIAAESALQLDSSFAPARELQEIVRREIEHLELIAGWLRSAKQNIAAGLPDEAEALVAKVLEVEPGNKQAAALQQQVTQDKVDRQKRTRLLERFQYARGLWTRMRYNECIQLLLDLQKEFPEDDEVPRLLETVREDQAEQRQQGLLDSHSLITARRYEECLILLGNLREQFPRDEDFPKLQEGVRRKLKDQQKQEGLTEAKSALAGRRYSDAIALLSSLARQFPEEPEIATLLETARASREEDDRQQSVAKARELLAAHRFDESIALLRQLQKDFPQHPEISDLLEIARKDQLEQEKHQKLAEARARLGTQSFEEALGILDSLAASQPSDAAVVKLRTLVQREQEKHVRQERMQRESDLLKKLISEKKYAEVIARSKTLLVEFPAESSFRRLAEFANSQQESAEKEQLFRQTLDEAKKLFDTGRFKEAITIVQIGLKSFPTNPELLYLNQQAELQQRKLEVRQQIEERVREIRVKINRERFSEAINIAKNTLVTLGPDTNVSQLLDTAEAEFEKRERKKEQVRALETIRTMIESGDLTGADQAVDKALDTKIVETFDPRIRRLSEQIKDAKVAANRESDPDAAMTSPGIYREYALQQGPPVPEAPPAVSSEQTQRRPVPTAQGSGAQPGSARPSSDPIAGEQQISFLGWPAGRQAEQAVRPEVAAQANPSPALAAAAPPILVSPSVAQPPEVQASRGVSFWKRTASAALVTIVLIALGWAGRALFRPSGVRPVANVNAQPAKSTINARGAQQRVLLNAAGNLIAANDLDGARKKLDEALALNGPLSTDIQRSMAAIDDSLKDPQLRQLRQREATLWQQAVKHVADSQYTDARKDLNRILALGPGGVHRSDAQGYLDKVIPQRIKDKELFAQAHLDIGEGEFQSARSVAEQLQQNGDEPGPLVAEIDRAERNRLLELETQFKQLKQRDDDAGIQRLSALQTKFQALASDGGPQSDEASGYANGIPAAIADVQGRMQKKPPAAPAKVEAHSAAADAVRAVIQRYARAFEKKDADTLTKIWPTIGTKYATYKSTFEAASSIRMRMNIQSVDVKPDGTNAIVEARVSEDYTAKDASAAKNSNHAVTFELDNVEGDWLITDIEELELAK